MGTSGPPPRAPIQRPKGCVRRPRRPPRDGRATPRGAPRPRSLPGGTTRSSVPSRSRAGKYVAPAGYPRGPRYHVTGSLERGSYPQPEDPSGGEPLHVGDRAAAEYPRDAVVRDSVVQEVGQVGEVVSVRREELGMVEGVVQQGGELQPELVLADEVLVEGEVHDPGARTRQAAILDVAVLARTRQGVGRQVEEMVARPSRLGIPHLIGLPAVREAVAEGVQGVGRVPGARRVVAAAPGGQVGPG